MLAMATSHRGDGHGTDEKHHVAVLDFAVSRDGALAQMTEAIRLELTTPPSEVTPSSVQENLINDRLGELRELQRRVAAANNNVVDLKRKAGACRRFLKRFRTNSRRPDRFG